MHHSGQTLQKSASQPRRYTVVDMLASDIIS